MTYEEYLKSPEWNKLRRKKLKKKPYCVHCKSRDNLQVHHLNYKNLADCKLEDLRTLCAGCHAVVHALMDNGLLRYKSSCHKHRYSTMNARLHKYSKKTKYYTIWLEGHERHQNYVEGAIVTAQAIKKEEQLDEEFRLAVD